jgi:hypothetical protein
MVTQISNFSLRLLQQLAYYQFIAGTFIDLGALAPILQSK